jgi:hypothetical protein
MHMIYQARRDNQGKITGDYLIISEFCRGSTTRKTKSNHGQRIVEGIFCDHLVCGGVVARPVECNTDH